MLAYLRQSLNFGLHYTKEVPVDSDPDLQRSRLDGHLRFWCICGTVVLLAGCPVQWESKKQSLMALSTAGRGRAHGHCGGSSDWEISASPHVFAPLKGGPGAFQLEAVAEHVTYGSEHAV